MLFGAPGSPTPPAGTPVRLIARTCDGTLGPAETLSDFRSERAAAARVAGCGGCAVVAVLAPPPRPGSVPLDDPAVAAALAAARAVAIRDRRGHEPQWQESALRIGDSVYALAASALCSPEREGEHSSCDAHMAVVARVTGDAQPKIVLARRASIPETWMERWLRFVGLTDWNGDGAPELIEELGSMGEQMIRVVAIGGRPAGEAVWRATYRFEGAVRPATTIPAR